MRLQQDATHLALKILSNLKVTDHATHLDDLQYTLLLALSKAYIKGRHHERFKIPCEELSDGSIFIPASLK